MAVQPQARDIYAAPERLRNITMSAIRQMMNTVAKMKQENKDVISFCVGEPDFNTPQGIKDAVVAALDANLTHYTANRGAIELRRAIAEKIQRETGVVYDPEEEVLVTSSGSEAINNALLGTLEEGDEVILLSPSFISYESLIYLCRATPVYLCLRGEDGFQLDIQALRSIITPRTKMIVMNNPCNPTGAVFLQPLLAQIAALAVEHNLIVFADEIYSRLVYDGVVFHSIAEFPGMRSRAIVMSGFSKNYAMTGWRVGYLTMDKRFMNNVLRVHQYSTTTGVTFIQHGLAASMNTPQVMADADAMARTFETRRNLIMQLLDDIPGLRYVRPGGAFYVMVDVSATGLSGEAFAETLLREAWVAVVPATGFGKTYTEYVRISYATSETCIREGLRRIRDFVAARQTEGV